MKRARSDAVHVLDVVDHANAESIEVEVRVACLQRVERPQHAGDAASGELFTLQLLEVTPHAGPTDALTHAEHVGPVNRLAVANAGETEHEADERAAGIERANGEPADTRDHANQRGRNVVERAPPDLRLERNTGVRVFGRRERPVREASGVGTVVRCLGGAGVVVEIERHGSGRRVGREASDNVRPCRAYHNGRPKRSPLPPGLIAHAARNAGGSDVVAEGVGAH